MISEAEFWGDCQFSTISANLNLQYRGKRFWVLEASVTNLKVVLPNATKLKTGITHFYIANVGIRDIFVADNSLNNLRTIIPGRIGIFNLLANTSVVGSWIHTDQQFFGGPTSFIKVVGGLSSFGTTFGGNLGVGLVKSLKSLASIGTSFSGKITQPNIKDMKGSSLASTLFRGNFGSFPTTKIVSPSASGSGDGSIGNPWTLKQAGTAAAPNDKIYLRGGTYPSTVSHILDSINATVVSGTAGNYIQYINYPGEVPTLTGQCRLFNCQYLKFSGIKWFSTGKSMVSTTTSSGSQRNLEFDGCEFESSFAVLAPNVAYKAILLYFGRDYAFRNCKFGKWYGGDFLNFSDADHILVEDCDFSQAAATHLLLGTTECSDVVVKNCLFRNPWSRVLRINRVGLASPKKRALVEDCAFIDSNWDTISAHPGVPDGVHPGDTETVRFQMEHGIFRNNIIVGHNVGQLDSNNQPASYSCGFQIHYFDNNRDYSHMRVYHNVIHDSDRCAMSFLYNISADAIASADHKFKNNSLTTFKLYGINITSSVLAWETWLFEKNRIYDALRTKTIFLVENVTQSLTVAEAESANSTVFKSNISSAPSYRNINYFTLFDDSPELLSYALLPDFFSAYEELSGSPGFQTGVALAKVTANGTTVTTISVDDSYWFMPTTDYYAGDKVLIGGDIVTITGVPSSTSITVTPAITVAINDQIFLERGGLTPNIGLIPLAKKASKTFASSSGLGTGFAGLLQVAMQKNFVGSMPVTTSFVGQLNKNASLFEITHEVGDLSEYTSTVTGGGDLSVASAAALKGSKGLSVVINDVGAIYGQKTITWSTQYLRFRFYFKRNTLVMTNGDDFYLVEFTTSGGQSSGYVRAIRTSGTYRVYAAQRDDAGSYNKTADVVIDTNSHYIEVEFKRAANASSVDGHTKIWLDGTLQDTISAIDAFDVTRPVNAYIGAVKGLESTTSGTIYLDDFAVRDESTVIGA